MPLTNTASAPVGVDIPTATSTQHEARAHALAEKFIGFLETGSCDSKVRCSGRYIGSGALRVGDERSNQWTSKHRPRRTWQRTRPR